MEVVARFAQQPWDAHLIQMHQVVSSPRFQSLLQIDIYSRGIRNMYLLAALYKAGFNVAGPHRRRNNLYVSINVRLQQGVGRLLYDLKRVEGNAANSTYLSVDSNLTKLISTSPSEQLADPVVASTSGLSDRRSGWASDPDDQRLRIHYEFQGKDLSPSNVFTTFLDAMIMAAQHNGNEPGARLIAFGADRRVSMRVSSILLTWTDLKKALMVLWQFVVVNYANPDLMIWGDVDFTIYDRDTFLGQGSIATTAPAASAVAEAR